MQIWPRQAGVRHKKPTPKIWNVPNWNYPKHKPCQIRTNWIHFGYKMCALELYIFDDMEWIDDAMHQISMSVRIYFKIAWQIQKFYFWFATTNLRCNLIEFPCECCSLLKFHIWLTCMHVCVCLTIIIWYMVLMLEILPARINPYAQIFALTH